MIIMLNGAFGVGKTTIAQLLSQRLSNNLIFDPEVVGTMVRMLTEGHRTGNENTDDYQDIKLWRTLTVQLARELRQNYRSTLIVPMTLANPIYFHEMKRGLMNVDAELHHFCLTASAHTIHERLKKRGEAKGSWPYLQTIRCLQAFQSEEFGHFIDTEHHSIEEIVEEIVRRI